MPINAFGGGPGSGKTYGVVEHVILPAVASGRCVITNIDGLNPEGIYSYVVERMYKGKILCIGHIRTCTRAAPGELGFFPGDESLDKPSPVPAPDRSTVAGGDLVVIDEATRYWPVGQRVAKPAEFFFREHRHFSNQLGETCDLVVIDPDITQLARALRGKIELSSITHKPKALGLDRYVVNLYRGGKVSGKPMSTNGPYKFSKEIYSLYKSYSHEKAKEQAIDGRQNIFRSKAVWGYIIGSVVALGVSVVMLWRFFNPDSGGGHVSAQGGAPGVASAAAAPAGGAGRVPAAAVRAVNFSSKWRVVGSYTARGQTWFVVADEAGRLRHESPAVFVGGGALAVGSVEGATVTSYSGQLGQRAGGVGELMK